MNAVKRGTFLGSKLIVCQRHNKAEHAAAPYTRPIKFDRVLGRSHVYLVPTYTARALDMLVSTPNVTLIATVRQAVAKVIGAFNKQQTRNF